MNCRQRRMKKIVGSNREYPIIMKLYSNLMNDFRLGIRTSYPLNNENNIIGDDWMERLPCNGCRGMCCGPIPITKDEMRKIKKENKSNARKEAAGVETATTLLWDLYFL